MQFLASALTSLVVVAIAMPALAAPTVLGDGEVTIAFTTPGVSAETAQNVGDGDALHLVRDAIDGAVATLDVCLYDFSHPDLIDAIVAAYDRGVTVRFVGDADELDQAGYIAMEEAGIESVLREKSGIQHNKFLVIDDRFVLTGSMNYTYAGVELNNNHVVRFDDLDVAAAYTLEFEQMFVDGAFGTSKTAIPHDPVWAGSTMVDIAFSPKNDPEILLRTALATADHSVHFMVYSFTRTDVAGDMLAKHAEGVEVIGIYDRFGASNRYATDDLLADEGVPTLIDGNSNNIGSSGAKLHHKVMIIDAGTDSDPMVIAGSFNWSGVAATTNDENMLILYGSEATDLFMGEFCEVFDAALPHEANTADIPDPCAAPVVTGGVRINELLPNPDGSDAVGEFIELVNAGDVAVDLAGFRVGDIQSDSRHTFDAHVLEPGAAIVVYSGTAGGDASRLVASSGALSLNNSSETVTLYDAAGEIVDIVSYSDAVNDVSFNRVDDGGLELGFGLHSDIAPDGANASPGTRIDGSAWVGTGSGAGGEEPATPVELSESRSGTVAVDQWQHYGPFEATSGNFVVMMEGDGDADLYVREGAAPTDVDFDCRPFFFGSSESCALEAPGTFYVSVKGWDPTSDFSLTINYTGWPLDGGQQGDPSQGDPTQGDLPEPNVIIDELLANPVGTDLGQEYVVLANTGTAAMDLSGATLSDASSVRHVFADGTVIEAGGLLVIRDRGDHNDGSILASTTRLSLNNSGDTITLTSAGAEVITTISYGAGSEGTPQVEGVDW